MKRHLRTLAFAALAAAAFACAKEPDEVPVGSEVEMTVDATFQSATKAVMDAETFDLEWEAGDQISLLYSTNNFALTGKSAGVATQFTGTALQLPDGEKYIAVYPYDKSYQLEGRTFQVKLPKVLKLIPESFTQTVGTGLVADGRVNFQHATAYLGFEITRDDITSIVISADGKNLSGTFKANVNNNGAATLSPVSGETSEELLVNTETVSGKYFVPIPADKYNGFSITFKSVQGLGETFVEKFSNLSAGKITDLGAIDADIEWKKGETPTVEVTATTSSTASVSWTVSNFASPAADVLKDWSVGLYRDAACKDLVVSWDIPSSTFTTPEGSIYAIEGPYSPRFIFSGLEADTEYYVKAWDTSAPEYASEPVVARTLASQNVHMAEGTARAGDVIISEDFSELVWGGDIAGRYWGYSDNNRSSATALNPAEGVNPTGKQTINGFEHNFYLVTPNVEMGLFNTLGKAIGTTRLTQWATIAEDGSNSKLCARPGYLKMGASSKAGGIVSPVLSPIEGKAIVKVTFKAHPYRETANDLTKLRVMAISTEESAIANNLIKTYTTGKSTDITLSDELKWKEYSCELLVGGDERIAIYSQRNTSKTDTQCRVLVDDIKIEVVEVFSASKIFEIKNATDLQSFLMFSDEYTTDETVVLANDIDLEGYELQSGGKFLGTLDGKDFSLMNWTSNGTPLFSSLAYDDASKIGGKVKNLKIDESCKLTPAFGSQAFGFIAKTVNAYSLLENCENNADITVNAETMGNTYFGTLAGTSYGRIVNCRNNGDITINISGDVTGNVYMGGVIGYSNIQTQSSLGGEYVYCMKDSQNSGNFLFTVGGHACNVFLGGVASGTSCGALSETSANKGTFKNCLNTGTVQYIVKNGASLEDNAGAAGKNDAYINMGGVVGYCEGSLESCVNRGPVKMQGPTLESAWALKRGAVGGVSGFVLFSVTDCENYGTVSAKSTWVNGTEKTAGAGNTSASSFGGVVGQAGLLTTAAAADYTFSGNHNHGALSFTDWMPSVNNSGAYFGGVVGYSTMKVTECSNNATMDVDTKTGHTYLGGVVGQCTAGVESLTNSGDLNVLAQRTTSTYTTDGEGKTSVTGQLGTNFRVGGVVAVVSDNKMVNSCTNNNAVTVNIESVDSYVAQVMVGGVLGRATCTFKNNINNGKVTVNQDPNTKGITLGGVVGWLQGAIGITKGENNGAVAYNAENSPATSYIGGFAGYINSTEGLSGVKNTAPVTVNHGGSGGACRVGGVIGHLAGSASTTIENLVNTETGVVSTTHLPKYFDVGGVIGRADKKLTFKSLSNAAPVKVSAPDERIDWFTVGGVMGRNSEESTYNGCSNSGDITVDAHTTYTNYCYVHGIAGEHDSKKSFTMTDNTNTGDIYVDCADTKCGWQIGGITSYSGGAGTNSGNVCKADITLVGTSTAIHNVGGIMGYCARSVYENCTYEGTITTNGAASGQFGYLGGIVGRSNNATMNFYGCTLKAVIKYGANSYGGVLDGDLNEADRTANIGAEGKVTRILSGSSVNGTAVTSALEDNLLVGTRLARTVNKQYCTFE